MLDEEQAAGGFAAALSRAIGASGLSLGRIRARLAANGNPVSMTTLSYWRSGARHPESAASLSAVDDLERILGLRAGELSALVRPTARLGVLPAPRMPFDEERERRETEETLLALRAAPQESLRDVSTWMTVFVGADGAIERTEYRCLVQVTRGVVTELPLIDVAPEETDEISVVGDVLGGRLDREYRHPGRLLSGIVIALDEPVGPGETAVFGFTERLPPGYPRRRSAWHATARPAKEMVIWVRFPAGAEPDWCEEYVEMEGEVEVSRPLALRGRAAHAVRHGFGPGLLGIRWGSGVEPETRR